MSKPILHQMNLVCGDVNASIAFYRRLGMEIPDAALWRTPSGAHHVNAAAPPTDQAIHFDLDTVAFARVWNSGWKDRADLRGRVVIGFRVPTRADIDDVFP